MNKTKLCKNCGHEKEKHYVTVYVKGHKPLKNMCKNCGCVGWKE